jgi:hypothetical protein
VRTLLFAKGQGLDSQPKEEAELTRCEVELNQQTNTLRAANTRIATTLGAPPPPAR